jgi:hypothetical protein
MAACLLLGGGLLQRLVDLIGQPDLFCGRAMSTSTVDLGSPRSELAIDPPSA